MPQISIEATDHSGTFSGHVSVPKGGTGPGMIVIQEIFGINGFVREVCNHYASLGYVAIAPDLFWRIEPGIDLDPKQEQDMAKAFELFGKFNVDNGVADIGATLAALRSYPACTGKVGAVGYCLGGLLAYLTATRTGIDASVGYYGVGIQDRLAEALSITHPLLLHIAENDHYTPPDVRAKLEEGLGKNALVTLHSYTGQDHAFARVGGDHYDKTAATLANRRTEEFFAQTLQ